MLLRKKQFHEPTSNIEQIAIPKFTTQIPQDLRETVDLVSTHVLNEDDICHDTSFDYGLHFDWSLQSVPTNTSKIENSEWLQKQIQQEEEKHT